MNRRRVVFAGLGIIVLSLVLCFLHFVLFPVREGGAGTGFVLPLGSSDKQLYQRIGECDDVLTSLGLGMSGHADGDMIRGSAHYGVGVYFYRGSYKGHEVSGEVRELYSGTPDIPHEVSVYIKCTARGQKRADGLAKMLIEDFLQGMKGPTNRSSRPEGRMLLSNVFSYASVFRVAWFFGRPLPAAYRRAEQQAALSAGEAPLALRLSSR